MEEDRDQPVCRMCECPALDGVVPLSTVDTDKLTKWCILHFGMQLDKLNVQSDVFCSSCVWNVRLLFENNEGSSEDEDLCWWPKENDNFSLTAGKEANMESCLRSKETTFKEKESNDGEEQQLSCIMEVETSGDDQVSRVEDLNLCPASKQYEQTDRPMSENYKLKWKCNFCEKVYRSNLGVRLHMQSKHSERYVECSFWGCTTFFKSQEDLYKHFEEKHKKEEIFSCEECKDKFGNTRALKQHIFQQHEKPLKTTKCNHCKSDVTSSMKLHHNSRNCKMCDSLFRNPTSPCKWTCVLCPEPIYFGTKKEMESHLILKHKSYKGLQFKLRGFKCKPCRTYFCNKQTLSTHNKEIHGEKKFICEFCGLSVLRRKSMKNHLLKIHHVGAANIECDLCKRKFVSNSVLQWHINMFHPQFRDVCEVCGEHVSLDQQKSHYARFHPNLLMGDFAFV